LGELTRKNFRYYDYENGFTEKAEYKNGSLTTKGGCVPDWINMLAGYLNKNQSQEAGTEPAPFTLFQHLTSIVLIL
jgi:hypothetical protein